MAEVPIRSGGRGRRTEQILRERLSQSVALLNAARIAPRDTGTKVPVRRLDGPAI